MAYIQLTEGLLALERDKKIIYSELMERFSQLQSTRPPKGFVTACQDIDIDIYEYEAYVAGLVTSYLDGCDIDATDIRSAKDLDRRLENCEARLHALKTYKALIADVAMFLIECLGCED